MTNSMLQINAKLPATKGTVTWSASVSRTIPNNSQNNIPTLLESKPKAQCTDLNAYSLFSYKHKEVMGNHYFKRDCLNSPSPCLIYKEEKIQFFRMPGKSGNKEILAQQFCSLHGGGLGIKRSLRSTSPKEPSPLKDEYNDILLKTLKIKSAGW